MKFLVKGANGIGAIIHRDADDLQPAVGILLLQFYEVGDFLAAGITPRRPEIEQNNLSLIRGQSKIVPVELRKREIGCGGIVCCT